MTQTYHDLTSLDEPDIFDINKNQNHILNQLILTALKKWEAHQIWYLSINALLLKRLRHSILSLGHGKS